MDKEATCFSIQLIDGDGALNGDGLDTFIKQVNMRELGLSYAVVAIMGPQSSGKSTLLNHLFGTNFEEMNVDLRRSQTTHGVWMAKCNDIEPCTIVMDLEGNDGIERGEDDTSFEKQIALFALAVSDIVLINMWYNDIGRVQASNTPLLRTIFQAMLKLFPARKTTLMFVIRDKRVTVDKLESDVRELINKIWQAIPNPKAHKLSDFFDIRVEALAHFVFENDVFKKEVDILREKFSKSTEAGGLAGDRRGVVPASGFSLSVQEIWKVIKKNKDLDLPSHKVMVADMRCEEIAKEKFHSFVENKEWLELKELVQSNSVPGFGKILSSLIGVSLSSYDTEAAYFDESGRNKQRKQLKERLIQEIFVLYESTLEKALIGPLETFLLTKTSDDTWPRIRKLLHHETETAVSELSDALLKFEMDEQAKEGIFSKLKNRAIGIVQRKAREEAAKVSNHLKDRFMSVFNHDNDLRERVWTDKDNIPDIAANADSECLKLLSVLAATRLDENTDTIWDMLDKALGKPDGDQDILLATTWEKVPEATTLITPNMCIKVWKKFREDTERTITKAIASQEMYKLNEQKKMLEENRIKREEIEHTMSIIASCFETGANAVDILVNLYKPAKSIRRFLRSGRFRGSYSL